MGSNGASIRNSIRDYKLNIHNIMIAIMRILWDM